jgi:hypothetical protein
VSRDARGANHDSSLLHVHLQAYPFISASDAGTQAKALKSYILNACPTPRRDARGTSSTLNIHKVRVTFGVVNCCTAGKIIEDLRYLPFSEETHRG